MQRFCVGEEFPIKIKDGISASFRGSRMDHLIGLNRISKKEVESFNSGEIKIYLSKVNDVIFLLTEIEGVLAVSDAPLLLDIIDEDYSPIPKGDMSYLLNIFLVDTSDNMLKGMRVIGLSNDLSHKLSIIVDGMMDKNLDLDEYAKTSKYVQSKMSSEGMADMAFGNYTSKPNY